MHDNDIGSPIVRLLSSMHAEIRSPYSIVKTNCIAIVIVKNDHGLLMCLLKNAVSMPIVLIFIMFNIVMDQCCDGVQYCVWVQCGW